MSENTKIEWADHTFNPWIGCTKVSPMGCANCYAEADFDKRRHVVKWGAGQPRKRTKTWGDPVRWNANHEAFYAEHGRRQRVFCASLADVFDNEVDPLWRADLFWLIKNTPHLDWLLLTKRIGNAHQMMCDAIATIDPMAEWVMPLPNIWLGATVVNQEEADRDIPKLLAVSATKRFLSIEPLLSDVDLRRWLATANVTCKQCSHAFWLHEAEPCEHKDSGSWTLACPYCGDCRCSSCWTPPGERLLSVAPPADWIEKNVGRFNRVHPKIQLKSAIDWVIVGGESGPRARPMHPLWVRILRNQCQWAGVPFLFKQWGEHAPTVRTMAEVRSSDAKHVPVPVNRSQVFPIAIVDRVGKKAAGRMLDGRTWDEVPN